MTTMTHSDYLARYYAQCEKDGIAWTANPRLVERDEFIEGFEEKWEPEYEGIRRIK
jgi:hypothetical protein